MTSPKDQPLEAEIAAMPFLDHLEELRRRLIKAFLGVVVMASVAFVFADEIMQFLMLPLGDTPLHNMQVTGTFYAYLKIGLFAGVVGALPIIFYQGWRFISPGLYRREKVMVLPLVATSTVLFLIGAGFCYLIVLPLALRFLIGFADELITNYITINSYISFAGLLLIAFGFAFQMPILAYFLGKFGLISSRFLARGRRYAIIIILVVAAIITPPDIITQVLLGVPLYLLYEISIIVVKVSGKRS